MDHQRADYCTLAALHIQQVAQINEYMTSNWDTSNAVSSSGHQTMFDPSSDSLTACLCTARVLNICIYQVHGDTHDVVPDTEGLAKYVPLTLLQDYEGREPELMQLIDAQHATLNGLIPFEAQIRYVTLVQSWPSYGSTVFEAEASNMVSESSYCSA